MNNFIKQVIEETFASKAQQKYFYARSQDKSLSKKEREKWGKMAKEFSKKTDFKKLPEKSEQEVDEVVDDLGNIIKGKLPLNMLTKGISSNSTSDDAVLSGGNTMGTHGVHGTHTSLRYWAESDMSKALGYEKTLGDDEDYKDAEDYFKNELGFDDKEAEERMEKIGYDKNLEGDKVRLIENPKKYMEEYIESVLRKKSQDNDILKNTEINEINPIVMKQINSLKSSIKNNNISINDVIELLKNNE